MSGAFERAYTSARKHGLHFTVLWCPLIKQSDWGEDQWKTIERSGSIDLFAPETVLRACKQLARSKADSLDFTPVKQVLRDVFGAAQISRTATNAIDKKYRVSYATEAMPGRWDKEPIPNTVCLSFGFWETKKEWNRNSEQSGLWLLDINVSARYDCAAFTSAGLVRLLSIFATTMWQQTIYLTLPLAKGGERGWFFSCPSGTPHFSGPYPPTSWRLHTLAATDWHEQCIDLQQHLRCPPSQHGKKFTSWRRFFKRQMARKDCDGLGATLISLPTNALVLVVSNSGGAGFLFAPWFFPGTIDSDVERARRLLWIAHDKKKSAERGALYFPSDLPHTSQLPECPLYDKPYGSVEAHRQVPQVLSPSEQKRLLKDHFVR